MALNRKKTANDIIEKLNTAKSHPFLSNSRLLENLLNKGITDKDLQSDTGRTRLADQIGKLNRLRYAYTRTRKREVSTDGWAIREPIKEFN